LKTKRKEAERRSLARLEGGLDSDRSTAAGQHCATLLLVRRRHPHALDRPSIGARPRGDASASLIAAARGRLQRAHRASVHRLLDHIETVGSVGVLLMGTRGPCGTGVPHQPDPGSDGKSGSEGSAHGKGMRPPGVPPFPLSGSTGKLVVPPCTADAASRSSRWARGKSLMNSEVMAVLLEE
jgi:hypothetical protein